MTMETKTWHSVRWYEPLRPGSKAETLFTAFAGTVTLPTGCGWHEQTLTCENHASQLIGALRAKGYALIEHRRYQNVNGLKIDC